jgi:23S rRNA-/tRNA-specific pseudouridylate synthase
MTGPDARKEYLALCRGPWGRGPDPVDVTTPIPDGRGGHKEALTTVRCLGTDLDARSALLHAAPRTGRHHQVRRHCRDLNHPVLGDGQHGDTRVNRMFRDTHGLDRLALHAWRLALPLPSGERLSVTAPLPTDLNATLHGLPFWPEALAAEPELARSPAQV